MTPIGGLHSGKDYAGSIKVFIVEDSTIIRTALTQRIEDDPRFTVVGYADTAKDAIGALDQDRDVADMVIVDLHLKQGTGYDILAHLHAAAAPAKFRTIVLTNYTSPAHRQRAFELGANSFFDKSMQFDEMLDTLRIWADEKSSGASKH